MGSRAWWVATRLDCHPVGRPFQALPTAWKGRRTTGARRMEKSSGVTLSLLVAGIVVSAGCRPPKVEAPLPIPVQVTTMALEQFATEMRYSATVKELQKVELSFKIAGTIRELHPVTDATTGQTRDVQVGDPIPAGTVLAKLDDADYRRRWNAAQEQRAKAESQQTAAEADADLALKDLKRSQELFAKGAETQERLDAAERRRVSTQAAVAVAEREVDAARIAEQQAQDDLDNCALIAPPLGRAYVAEKFVEKSERVGPAQRAFLLIDVSKVRVAFGVPEQVVGDLRLGQPLPVVAEALGGLKFVGRVSKISPAADLETRTFLVEVTIDEPGRLKPGMIATISIGEDYQGLLLPMTAIQRGRHKPGFVVYKVAPAGGQAVVRECRVELGGVYDNRIEVKTGPGTEIAAGDAIVVVGAWRLADGQQVRVIPEVRGPTEEGRS